MTLRSNFIEYCSHCFEGGLVIDKDNKAPMKHIFDTFEANKFGVLLIGQTGSGKSLVFEVLHRILNPNDKKRFKIESSMDIVHDYNSSGSEVFEAFKQKRNFVIDDLGVENMGRFFGTDCNVLEDLIQIRYNLFKTDGFKTHFTTNLIIPDISKKYGSRVLSRLGEMCEIVVLGGNADHIDRRRYRNFNQWLPVHHNPVYSEEDLLWYQKYQAMTKTRQSMTKSQLDEERRIARKEQLGFCTTQDYSDFKKSIL